VDKVLAAGYDGVYLDIVDAYQYWEPREPGVPVEDEMVDFVKDIATYARVTHDHPNFQVFVQNAEELSSHPDYVEAVSGIGKEDLFYNGNRRQPDAEVRWSVQQLDRFKEAGKPVLVTDYVTRRARIDAFYQKAQSHGYVLYATRRDLDALTINRGHQPD
jgi:cysteinyl-tRNA synthetase